VKSTCETLEGNKVLLKVEVDAADFERDIEVAFSKIAREVRLPGFRQGKAPRRVLEARIGLAAAREQALRDGVPTYLARAVRENNVDIIATPDVEITGGADDGDVAFSATCEVRPVITVPGHEGLRVEVGSVSVGDDEIQNVVDAELRRQGELVTVDRSAATGDFVVVDLVGTRDGEPVPGLAVDDWSYEIGKKWVTPEFDDHLIGSVAGSELRFTGTPNGTESPADFVVAVQSVQELVVPALDDAWVAANVDGHETVADWRTAVADRLAEAQWGQIRQTLVEKVTDVLAELVTVDPPEALVAADLQRRVENTARQFQMQGIDLAQWLAATGQEVKDFVESLRPQSVKAAKVDLALRAVVVAQGLAATEDDVDRELSVIAARSNENAIRQQMMSGSKKKPKLVTFEQVKAAYEANDALADLAAEVSKSKALDWLVHHVTYVDDTGKVLDGDTVVGYPEADHDYDHEIAGESDEQENA